MRVFHETSQNKTHQLMTEEFVIFRISYFYVGYFVHLFSEDFSPLYLNDCWFSKVNNK